MSRLSVSMAYYRRNYYNFWREDNVLQSNGDYTPFDFTGPADPRLNEFSGSTQTLFNLNPTVFGQSQRVLNNVDNIPGAGTSGCITAWNGRCRDGSARAGSSAGASTTRGPRKKPAVSKTATAPSGATRPARGRRSSRPMPRTRSPRSISSPAYSCRGIRGRTSRRITPPRPQRSSLRPASSLTGIANITYDLLPPDTYFLPFQTKVDLRFMRAFTMGARTLYADGRHLQPAQREHDDVDQQYLLLDRLDRMAGDHVGHAGPAGPDRGPVRLVESAADLKVRTTTTTAIPMSAGLSRGRRFFWYELFLVRSGRL